MPEPSAAAGLMGVKFASLVAGFAGGVVSLSFLKKLSPVQMGTAVVAGTLTAGYLTPAVLAYVHLDSSIENAVAFLVGLTAMNVIPGILRASEWVRDNPFKVLRGKVGPDDGAEKP